VAVNWFSSGFDPVSNMAASDIGAHIFIPLCAVVGIMFAIFMWIRVSRITVAPTASDDSARAALMEGGAGEEAVR
jgi:hypothetical protein